MHVLGGKRQIELFFTLNTSVNARVKLRVSINSGLYSNNQFFFLGETEEQIGDLKINFSKAFSVEFFFEVNQKLAIEVISNNNLVETFTTTLAAVVGNKEQLANLVSGAFNLTIFTKPSNEEQTNLLLQSQLSFELKNSNEYFYVLSNKNDNKEWRRFFKSTEMRGTSITFPIVSFSFDNFVQSNESQPIKIELFTIDHIKVGEIENSLIRLAKEGATFEGGALKLIYKTKEQASINKYLQKGLDINLMVSIDFTGSNGDPNVRSSLHYHDQNTQSCYQKAIKQCGQILAYYDSDKLYPVVGFGAEVGNPSQTSFSFPLNLNWGNPLISTVDGISDAYVEVFKHITFSGPTYFRFFLNEVFSIVKANLEQNQLNYYVLMIITDGEISDLKETSELIADNCNLPISIVIIGVGSSEFYCMNELDGDQKRLVNSYGKESERDIVQFVPFDKYANNLDMLSKEVLKEIPGQIEEYFTNFSNAMDV